MQLLKENRIVPDCYYDKNDKLWGKVIEDGIECITEDELSKDNYICFIMISSHWIDEALNDAKLMGLSKIVTYDEMCEIALSGYYDFMSEDRIAVYTCITNGYDELRSPEGLSENCDCYLITDGTVMTDDIRFKIINIEEIIPNDISLDATRINRYCKINAHKFFLQYRYSIYFDGNIQLKENVENCINRLPITRIITLSNNVFDDVYMEAMRAAEHGRDNKTVIYDQVKKYWLEGMPQHFGSFKCGVLIREHNNPICRRLMDNWWKEVFTYSRKDQISFPYVLWKNGYRSTDVDTLNGNDFYSDDYLDISRNHLGSRTPVL